jgi:TonB family protein
MVPAPPAIVPAPQQQPKTPQADDKAIPIPEKIEAPKKKEPEPKPKPKSEPKSEVKPDPKAESKPAAQSASKTTAKPKDSTQEIGNAIPTAARPGSGGVANSGGGSGGGIGGGTGISVGTGSGGVGDSWYAQVVERRISESWLRPPEGMRVDGIYSFYINNNGIIYDIKKESSSGNPQLDLNVERAIRGAKQLPAPPREFQGKAIQFVARFVHPPDSIDIDE